jgi:FkbM family methyltransferase
MSFRRALLDIFTKTIGGGRLMRSLERVFFEQQYQMGDVRFRVNLSTSGEKWRWDQLMNRTKEPETLKWIEDTLSEEGVYFDIGANIGNYTVYAGKCHPRLRIFAFEPEPCSFIQLSKNILLNDLSAVAFLMPLSDQAQPNMFYMKYSSFLGGAGQAHHQFGRTVDQEGKEFRPAHFFGVHSCTVDQLVGTGIVPAPNYIKIDVDGIEDKVVGGMRSTLASEKLRGVLCEISGTESEVEKLLRTFETNGFAVVRRPPSSSGNYIFERR